MALSGEGWSFINWKDKSLVLNVLQMFLRDQNITGSMNRKGNCYDNALIDILNFIEMFYNSV